MLNTVVASTDAKAWCLAHKGQRVKILVPLVQDSPLDSDSLRELIDPVDVFEVLHFFIELLRITSCKVHVIAFRAIRPIFRILAIDAKESQV